MAPMGTDDFLTVSGEDGLEEESEVDAAPCSLVVLRVVLRVALLVPTAVATAVTKICC